MLILTLRTDKPESEIGLYRDSEKLAYFEWHADRQLAETIHLKIKEVLDGHETDFNKLEGIVVYMGPGSFTGLRIGIAVANACAYGLTIPIIGSKGDNWIAEGIKQLLDEKNDSVVIPEYGAPPNITKPRK